MAKPWLARYNTLFRKGNKLELLALIIGACTLTYLIMVTLTSISVAVMPLCVAILIIIVLISVDILLTACNDTPNILIPYEAFDNTTPHVLQESKAQPNAGYYSSHRSEDELVHAETHAETVDV